MPSPSVSLYGRRTWYLHFPNGARWQSSAWQGPSSEQLQDLAIQLAVMPRNTAGALGLCLICMQACSIPEVSGMLGKGAVESEKSGWEQLEVAGRVTLLSE